MENTTAFYKNIVTLSSLSETSYTVVGTENVTGIPMNVCDSNSTLWLLTSPVCSTKYESFATFVIVAILLCSITFITVFGNLLVLVALYRFKKLRSMSNCLIGNLAVSDLLLALSVLPISTSYDLLGYWVFGEIMCTIWLCIDVLYCTASIWGLCTIAADRYTATVYPVWYHEKKSPTRALVYIIFVWLFSIIVSVAPFIGWREMIPSFYQYNPVINKQDCVLFMSESYVVYSAMGSFVIPTVLMVFLYVRIFTVLKQRTRSMKPTKCKRVCYPSESDFESEARGLDEPDTCSDERTEVELRVASTQTTPTNGKHARKSSHENGVHSRMVNGNTGGVTALNNKHAHMDYGKRTSDCMERKASQPNVDGYTRTSLTIEITDLTDSSNGTHTIPIVNNHLDLSNKNKNCNLSVDFDKNRGRQDTHSPSRTSRKSCNFTDDVSEAEFDTKYYRTPRASTAMFFPWKNRQGKNTCAHMTIKHKYEMREQRATKRMAMIMACFCFCWWPFLFMYTIRSFCENCPINIHLQATIIWLGYANSSLNPILYTIFNDDFRKAFHKIVFCKRQPNRRRR